MLFHSWAWLSYFYTLRIPTVIISGPTYYNEAKFHKSKIVFPKVPCKYTPCKSKKLKNTAEI